MKPTRSAHCRWSHHDRCDDGAAIACKCWCHRHPSKSFDAFLAQAVNDCVNGGAA